MKKFLLASAVLALLGASVTMSLTAQPPRNEFPPSGDRRPDNEFPDGPPPEGRRHDGKQGEHGRPPMPNPLVAALDTNGDREISAEELQAATASLLTLDKNGDGKLTDDETRPPRPEGGGPDGAPRNDGPRDGGPRNGGGQAGAGRGDGPQGRDGGGPSGTGAPRRSDGTTKSSKERLKGVKRLKGVGLFDVKKASGGLFVEVVSGRW